MGTIASLVGSGAGLIIIGATFIAMMHYRRLPGATHKILGRLFIVSMFAGGSALSVTAIGSIWQGIAGRLADLFGGLDTGLPKVTIVLVGFFLLLGTVMALIFDPVDAAILLAAFVPAVLMLVPGGFLHQVYVATSIPAQQMADSFSAWIGG